jgi:hypothetical protein
MYVAISAYDFTLLWPSVKWTRWTTYSGYSQRLPDHARCVCEHADSYKKRRAIELDDGFWPNSVSRRRCLSGPASETLMLN